MTQVFFVTEAGKIKRTEIVDETHISNSATTARTPPGRTSLAMVLQIPGVFSRQNRD
jgi:hypothetical protein